MFPYISGLCLYTFAIWHKLCVKEGSINPQGPFKPLIILCFHMQKAKVAITNV